MMIRRKAKGYPKNYVNIIILDKWGNVENAFIDIMDSSDREFFEQLDKEAKIEEKSI